MARAYDDARGFSVSDGRWSDVSSRMHEATTASGEVSTTLKDTKEKCAELDKGKESPYIVESLASLKVAHSGSKQLTRRHPQGLGRPGNELRRDLAASYVVNADKVRMAICDGDEENIQSRVEDAEKAAQGNLSGRLRDARRRSWIS